MDTRLRPLASNIDQDFDARTLLGAACHCNGIQNIDDPTGREAAKLYGSFVKLRPVHSAVPAVGLRPISFWLLVGLVSWRGIRRRGLPWADQTSLETPASIPARARAGLPRLQATGRRLG